MMRRFILVRDVDITGVSGTGKVAEGVQFGDGHAVMRWCTPGKPASTSSYDVVDDIATIHGHGGSTRVEWIDEEYAQRPRATVPRWMCDVNPPAEFAPYRNEIAERVVELDRRDHPEDYPPDCRCEGGVHVCE